MNRKDVSIRTSRLKRKSSIRMHKPLNAQNLYNLQKAVYVRTIRLTRKIRAIYKNPHAYAQAAYIAQSCTQTYAKSIQPMQSRLNCAKSYKYVRKSRKPYAKPHTFCKAVQIRTQKMHTGL